MELGSLRNNGLMSKLTYSCEDLLSFRYNTKAPPSPSCDVPLEIIYSPQTTYRKRKRRKRGTRVGIRNRIKRRGSRFPLPTITLTNACSLKNKMSELVALMRYNQDFKKMNLFCIPETWLTGEIDDINLEKYSLI